MNRVRALLISFLGAAVLMAALSYDAVLWAQDFAAGFPGGGGRGIGLLNALYCQLASPCVLTGDNASGTGTLRIRTPDEDTQVVLCEASNNSTPEMCSNIQHINISTTQAFSALMTNGYYDSASAVQRRNTASGVGGINTSAGTTAANTFVQLFVNGTGGASAGSVLLQGSGLATSNLIVGSVGTVTTDIRGPILNGGSATCNGIAAGSICLNDDTIVQYSAAGAFLYQYATSAATGTGSVWTTSSGTAAGSNGYYNASFADADYADKATLVGYSKLVSVVRHDDVAAGSVHTEFRDNATGTGVVLMDVLGNGTVRPLLYGSQSNCSDGAGAAACSAAPAGSVVIDDGATTVVVSTTAVTANSQIFPVFDSSLGTKLGVTCNTTAVTPSISARTAATSFTITAADPAGANPACFSYLIVN